MNDLRVRPPVGPFCRLMTTHAEGLEVWQAVRLFGGSERHERLKVVNLEALRRSARAAAVAVPFQCRTALPQPVGTAVGVKSSPPCGVVRSARITGRPLPLFLAFPRAESVRLRVGGHSAHFSTACLAGAQDWWNVLDVRLAARSMLLPPRRDARLRAEAAAEPCDPVGLADNRLPALAARHGSGCGPGLVSAYRAAELLRPVPIGNGELSAAVFAVHA